MNEAIAGMNMFDLGGQFLRVSLCFHILCLGVAFFHKFSCKIMARYNSALTENTSLRYTNVLEACVQQLMCFNFRLAVVLLLPRR